MKFFAKIDDTQLTYFVNLPHRLPKLPKQRGANSLNIAQIDQRVSKITKNTVEKYGKNVGYIN